MAHSTRPGTPQYLRAEGERLLAFARNARLPDWGYGWLDSAGSPMADDTVHTYITARMTHVFSLAVLLGHEWAADYADHGIAALTGPLHDDRHDGWHTATDRAGRPLADEKAAYPHTFVVLAAASATMAGRPGAAELLARALGVIERRFREPETWLVRERWDSSWSSLDTYRGGNSNMHAVEALLAASDATGDPALADQALEIATFLVDSVARNTDWRIVEHFDENWSTATKVSSTPWTGRADRSSPSASTGCSPKHSGRPRRCTRSPATKSTDSLSTNGGSGRRTISSTEARVAGAMSWMRRATRRRT